MERGLIPPPWDGRSHAQIVGVHAIPAGRVGLVRNFSVWPWQINDFGGGPVLTQPQLPQFWGNPMGGFGVWDWGFFLAPVAAVWGSGARKPVEGERIDCGAFGGFDGVVRVLGSLLDLAWWWERPVQRYHSSWEQGGIASRKTWAIEGPRIVVLGAAYWHSAKPPGPVDPPPFGTSAGWLDGIDVDVDDWVKHAGAW